MAIERAETDYCMNFNTDDHLYPAALTTMASYARAWPEADIIYSRCFKVQDPEHRVPVQLYDWPEYSHERLLEMCLCGPFPLVKRESLVKVGMFNPDYRISGDYEMWLRMSAMGCVFRKVPETIGSYYLNPVGLSSDKSTEPERMRQLAEIRSKYRQPRSC
jgi:GT2 family glycosyltransferase